MYYSVCDTDQRFDEDDQESLLNYCLDLDYFEDDDDGFRDYVREQYGSVEVCGYDFDALDILESDDYVYCEAKRDWANNELDNARDNAEYELRHATPGDTIWIGSYEVDVCEYEEEDEEEEEESDIQISIWKRKSAKRTSAARILSSLCSSLWDKQGNLCISRLPAP